MRVSADKWCEALGCSPADVAVFLDDVMVEGCIAADTDEGWVDVRARDASGKPKRIAGELVTERRYGRVEVKRWKRK